MYTTVAHHFAVLLSLLQDSQPPPATKDCTKSATNQGSGLFAGSAPQTLTLYRVEATIYEELQGLYAGLESATLTTSTQCLDAMLWATSMAAGPHGWPLPSTEKEKGVHQRIIDRLKASATQLGNQFHDSLNDKAMCSIFKITEQGQLDGVMEADFVLPKRHLGSDGRFSPDLLVGELKAYMHDDGLKPFDKQQLRVYKRWLSRGLTQAVLHFAARYNEQNLWGFTTVRVFFKTKKEAEDWRMHAVELGLSPLPVTAEGVDA